MPELSNTLRSFLDEVHFAVVATIASDGIPHQTVMWYLLDGDALVLNTPEGSLKHKHLLRDPRISVCIEDGFRYATLIGSVEVTPDPDRKLYGQLGQRYLSGAIQPPTGIPSARAAELMSRSRIALRMNIERVISNGLGQYKEINHVKALLQIVLVSSHFHLPCQQRTDR